MLVVSAQVVTKIIGSECEESAARCWKGGRVVLEGIDSSSLVAWRASTSKRVVVPARQAGN